MLTVVYWALIFSKALGALKLLLLPLLLLLLLLPWLPLRSSDIWTTLNLRGFPSCPSQAKDTTYDIEAAKYIHDLDAELTYEPRLLMKQENFLLCTFASHSITFIQQVFTNENNNETLCSTY